jgi:hypothetical protein
MMNQTARDVAGKSGGGMQKAIMKAIWYDGDTLLPIGSGKRGLDA